MKKIIFVILFLFSISSSDAQSIRSDQDCLRHPSFPKKFGFDSQTAMLSTAEIHDRGLTLIDPASPQKKSYKHPTWRLAGSLGGMTFDEKGTVYTFPAPHVELTFNPPTAQNILYKVNPENGIMSQWINLPINAKAFDQNVFGILGITFSCFSKSIYVSSVMGSSRTKELGKIYQLNAETGAILNTIENFDGFGLATASLNNKWLLFLGNARTSDLYSVPLNDQGAFIGKPKRIFSLIGLGPRGDDKIKKIIIKEQGLQITGFEFNFNLSATWELQQTFYQIPLNKLHMN
ncbi:MAG: hypothetical protein SGJ02_04485 [bacterium]|nr:hypothetical protein [bacterium]